VRAIPKNIEKQLTKAAEKLGITKLPISVTVNPKLLGLSAINRLNSRYRSLFVCLHVLQKWTA